jgi:hypothetical protein
MISEDTNTRVIFERLLNSENALPPERAGFVYLSILIPIFLIYREIWDKYLEFESQVGDLTSVLNIDQRRRTVNPAKEEHNALWLIDRYRFLNLTPCRFFY